MGIVARWILFMIQTYWCYIVDSMLILVLTIRILIVLTTAHAANKNNNLFVHIMFRPSDVCVYILKLDMNAVNYAVTLWHV